VKKWKVVGFTLSVIGMLAFIGSFVWRGVAVPALVRYPTDLDVTPAYEGTVTVFLDPATYAPLATPQEYPLTVERHLEALGDESSKDRVVIRETLTLEAPGLFDTTVQEHQYVMDRRKMVNVDDPRAWAFTPDNPVNRAGTYRLQFPFDADAESYPVYKNEIDRAYTATKAAQPDAASGVLGSSGRIDFEDFTAYAAEEQPTPITEAYREALTPIVQLPDTLTIDQIRPILTQAGIDLDATLAALTPVIEPADLETLLTLAGQPIALSYTDSFRGGDLIEPYTGSIVAVTNVTETVYATPDAEVTTTLQAILDKYPQVPEAATASAAISAGKLSQIPVFTNEYAQTPASIADVWSDIEHQRDQRRLAERTIPWALLIGGIVIDLVGTGLVLTAFRRQRRSTGPSAPPADAAPADQLEVVPARSTTIDDLLAERPDGGPGNLPG
jgi:hypothetical protein